MQIIVRELRKLRHVLKFAVAEENHGDRKEQVTQDRGSTRAPQWTGGGVVFAPVPRDYSFKMNKKEKRAALKSVLTSKVQENKFIVLDELKLAEVKTKEMKKVLDNLKVNNALVIIGDDSENVALSARNIAGVQTASVNTINVFDMLKYNTIIATKSSVASIEEVYA